MTDPMPRDTSDGLRILHIVRQYLPSVGGMEYFIRDLAAEQIAMGHHPRVLTLNRILTGDKPKLPAEETIDGVPVRRIGYVGKRRYFLPFLTPGHLRDADILHVHATDPLFDLVSVMARRTGTPAVVTTHGGFFHTTAFAGIKKVYFQLITRRTCRGYGRLFAISEQDEGYFQGIHPHIVRLPNGIKPIGDFTASGRDMLYIGRLASHKGVEHVIRALAAMPSTPADDASSHGAPPPHFHVVGPEWDVSPADLQALAVDCGVADRVHLHGFVDDAALQALAARCGLFVSGSQYEGFGMSMVEAMAVGLVPVVHANASFQELVGKAGVGKAIDFTDAAAAGSALADVLSGITADQRAQARAFADNYSWRKVAERCQEQYQELLAERR